MAFVDNISDYIAKLKVKETLTDFVNSIVKKGKKKSTPNTEMALEILMLVQEALDNKDDPDKLTATLGRIQQVANHALGESTPLLTGPKNEEKALVCEEVLIDQIGQAKKNQVDFDEHIEVAEEVVEVKEEPQVEEVVEEKVETPVESVVEEREEPQVEIPVEEKDELQAEKVVEEKVEPKIEKVVEAKEEPQAEEVVEEKAEPQVEEVVEEKDEPQVEEVVEEKEKPQAEEVVEEKEEPQSEEVVEEKEEPQAEEVVEVKEEPQVEEVVEETEEPQTEEVVEEKEEPQVEEVVEVEVEPEVEPEPMDMERFVGKRVLYAFGNAEEDGMIQSACKTWQITLDTVTSGLTAVKAFSASELGTYDAIILEKSMPLMNGFMAAKCIRKDKHAESETIPIIISAVGSPVGQSERESNNLSACLNEGTERELYDVLSEIWKKDEVE